MPRRSLMKVEFKKLRMVLTRTNQDRDNSNSQLRNMFYDKNDEIAQIFYLVVIHSITLMNGLLTVIN